MSGAEECSLRAAVNEAGRSRARATVCFDLRAPRAEAARAVRSETRKQRGINIKHQEFLEMAFHGVNSTWSSAARARRMKKIFEKQDLFCRLLGFGYYFKLKRGRKLAK